MNRATMLSELREVLNDSATNGLWLESTLLGYLAEGQDVFCEKTGYFTDITTHTITLATNTAVYAIPARIIQVLDIYNGRIKLGKILPDDVTYLGNEWYFDPNRTGMPTHWRTDKATGSIELTPTPTATENGTIFTLQVWRYSEDALDDTDKEPEIPARFRRACIEWAAYKAFNHHDMEEQDPIKAADHLRAFNAYVREGKIALQRIQNMETRVGTAPAYRT